ncbi:hypothetical protein GYW21_09575 [Lactobacillus mellis]|nr:hypothetical protein [Bombilactobacillus mellis]
MSPAGIRELLQYDGFNAEQIDFAIRYLSN